MPRRLKKRRPKKRIRAIIRLLFGTNTMKADEILSDFSKGMIIRFLPPKIASAVRKYGDVTIFDDSASFLSLPFAGRLKSSGPKKRKQIILIRHLYVPYCEKGVGILTDSCIWFDVFAFSASDFAARRTIVRLARRNRTLQTILSLPFARRLKKRRPKKRIRAIIRLLFGTNTMKADEILSDFSKVMIIRFFYRRKSPLPYASTAT